VYELLPLDLQSRFFTATARIWYDHYNSIPKIKADQKDAYAKYAAKQQVILDGLLELASRRLHQKLEQEPDCEN
jgi:UDP-N-acetylmuramyl pentapeptide synthase